MVIIKWWLVFPFNDLRLAERPDCKISRACVTSLQLRIVGFRSSTSSSNTSVVDLAGEERIGLGRTARSKFLAMESTERLGVDIFDLLLLLLDVGAPSKSCTDVESFPFS